MISVLATAILLAAEPTFSMEIAPSYPQRVLDQIGAKIGRKLSAGPNIRNDFFMVRFQEKSGDAILKTLADALEGEWKPLSDGSLQLDRRPKPVDLAKQHAEMGKKLDEAIAKEVPKEEFDAAAAKRVVEEAVALTKMPEDDPMLWRNFQKIQGRMPMGAIARRMLQAVGGVNLAALPEGKTVWYANTGGTRNRPLSSAQMALVQKMEAQKELLLAEVKRVPEGALGERGYLLDFLVGGGNDEEQKGAVNYALRVIRRGGGWWGGAVSVQATLYRYQGTNEEQASVFVNVGMINDGEEVPKEAVADSVAKGLTTKFRFSPEQEKLFGKEGRFMRGVEPAVSQAWREMMQNIEKKDMLEYFAGDLPLAVAREKGRDLVAVIPDVALFGQMSMQFQTGETTLEAAYATNKMIYGERQTDDGTTIILRPEIWGSSPRLDRVKLKGLLTIASLKRDLTLDDYAALASTVGDQEQLQFYMTFLMFLSGGDTGQMNWDFLSHADLLKLYHSLSASQKQQARQNGFSLPFGSLSKEQKGFVEDMVFEGYSVVGGLEQAMAHEDPRSVTHDGTLAAWQRTPALALSNGIPDQTTIWVRVTAKDEIFGRTSANEQQPAMTQKVSATDLAMAQAMAAQNPAGDRGWPPNYTEFTTARRELLRGNVILAPNKGVSKIFAVDALKIATWGNFDSLPEAFRAEVAKMKEQYKDIRFGGGGGSAPPRTGP